MTHVRGERARCVGMGRAALGSSRIVVHLWVQNSVAQSYFPANAIAQLRSMLLPLASSLGRGAAHGARGGVCGTISLCGVPSTAACERSSRQLAAFMCLAMCRPLLRQACWGVCGSRARAPPHWVSGGAHAVAVRCACRQRGGCTR